MSLKISNSDLEEIVEPQVQLWVEQYIFASTPSTTPDGTVFVNTEGLEAAENAIKFIASEGFTNLKHVFQLAKRRIQASESELEERVQGAKLYNLIDPGIRRVLFFIDKSIEDSDLDMSVSLLENELKQLASIDWDSIETKLLDKSGQVHGHGHGHGKNKDV